VTYSKATDRALARRVLAPIHAERGLAAGMSLASGLSFPTNGWVTPLFRALGGVPTHRALRAGA